MYYWWLNSYPLFGATGYVPTPFLSKAPREYVWGLPFSIILHSCWSGSLGITWATLFCCNSPPSHWVIFPVANMLGGKARVRRKNSGYHKPPLRGRLPASWHMPPQTIGFFWFAFRLASEIPRKAGLQAHCPPTGPMCEWCVPFGPYSLDQNTNKNCG